MLAKIIFFAAVSAATLVVLLLAFVHNKSPEAEEDDQSGPCLALSLYIQPPHLPHPHDNHNHASTSTSDAFIFHQHLTEGPNNTSRVIGKAQGFIIPVDHSVVLSAFNVIYLSFDSPEYSGSLSVEAEAAHKNGEELTVVGGTGSFAFARGTAIFAKKGGHPSDKDETYHLKLRLRFPQPSPTIPG